MKKTNTTKYDRFGWVHDPVAGLLSGALMARCQAYFSCPDLCAPYTCACDAGATLQK